ncbi:MAG: GAF domain-containing protein [Anaerolineae bacterium]|nr:GAF domain-containing protein [Anaerolineae bacterium]MDW8171124.1 GAF domain-containing protein [Anaerolineae bacterium]
MASTTLTSESLSQYRSLTSLLARWLPPIIGVISMLAYVVLALAAFNWRTQPFIGAVLTHTMVVNAAVPGSSNPWNGLAAGLRHQDFVIAVNGQRLAPNLSDFAAMRATYNSLAQTWQVGDQVTFEVIRKTSYAPIDAPQCQAVDRETARCTFSFTLQTFPAEDFISFFVVAYITGLIVIGMGWAVWYLRSDHVDGQLASSSMFLTAVFIGGLFDLSATRTLTPLWLIWTTFGSASLAVFAMIFPSRLPIVRKNPGLMVIPFIIAAVVSAYAIYKQSNPLDPYDNGANQLVALMAIGSVVFLALVMGFVQRPRALTQDARDQVNAILIGSAMLLIPATVWLANRVLMAALRTFLPIALESLMPLAVFTNAAIAYAVLQFRALNTDRIISQSITYSIMLGTLIISVFLMTLGGTLIAIDLFNANSVLTISIILFVMVMGFTPLRTRVQEQIDRVYFRARRNYQQKLEEFGQNVARSLPFEELTLKFRQALQENVSPSRIFIFLIDRDAQAYVDYAPQGKQTDVSLPLDGPIVKMMSSADQPIILERGEPLPPELWTDRARLQLLRAHMLVPMRGADRLNGVVILGAPLSGRSLYNFEETRFIINLVSQYAVATERAQVIESLERRVRELDVLSQVGQAVSFTTEFDDLLELISAQTARLISAPCFYIALYDEEAKQLYFAFFSEDDDRRSDKENVRWPLDDGLFSEVVREGRPVRVPDYGREMLRRDATIRLEARDMRAWMGMPLIAGRRILGVIALGKRKTFEPFSDDQFKIFSDISALAATSIDKARLFTETKIRERQLTVLNDISRKLVATESDVEKLLEIIMSSAVDILNAEAGSLLLNTEDASQDLEFRVVIGGSGANLIGQRISSGTGIAGQVAKTGRALIVNDAANNPDHRAQSDFKANSLLAVPLIAKDVVIGVLEVLNKRDGTSFTQADSDLLTTFASQAAVAIENARLFRMTDIQLSQRVRELEALERIDNELNRTLDVAQVAAITVQSAMRILGAQGGLLGIVNESATQLEIVAIEGYDADDYPDGVEGRIWPLDKGIISRVVRLRQPDLAVDVSIDPDFKRGIKGSISQITIPMFSGDDLNAILVLERNQLPRFSLTDWSFAQRIAEHASIAIANAQLYAALMRANKSKSDFMGFAAHELKNPLASVKGYADVLLTGMTGALSEQQRSFVSIIHSNANRMQTIIEDLRASAQLDADEFRVDLEPMNIWNAVLETLRPFIHFLRDKNQELVNEVPEDLPLIMGDSTRLIQVLTNLVSNAHKYSPPDTTIRITARVVQNFVDPKGKRRGPMVVVSVIDQGIGISEEDQKRLFREKYFRSSNKAAQEQPGTGLGMMLTQGIVHKHNGEIWVESELGKGSTFHVALPLAPQEFQTRIGELSVD